MIEAPQNFSKNDESVENNSTLNQSIRTKHTEKNEEETNSRDEITSCPVCNDGNRPTGLHKCYTCDKSVHLMDGCSVSIGNEEGCGEKRQCMQCQSNEQKQSETTKAFNMEEKWSKKTDPSRANI